MSAGRQITAQRNPEEVLTKHAVNLFSQQIWCWGRDIQRSEGNWLLEIGFDRIVSPPESDCSNSVYSLELPNGRRIILRGYGVFYGDDRYGGIFLPRYEFLPTYSTKSGLETPPWTKKDLPDLELPTSSQHANYTALVIDLIDWIHGYEEEIVERLGIENRRFTLNGWDNGTRTVIPAEEMIGEWSSIRTAIMEGNLC